MGACTNASYEVQALLHAHMGLVHKALEQVYKSPKSVDHF